MVLVCAPQPLIHLIMASFSPGKSQSASFSAAQLTKCRYLNRRAFQPYLVRPRSFCHNANVIPQLNLNLLLLGRARRLMPMGGSPLQGKCC